MSTHVADCESLVDDILPDLCGDGAYNANIDTTPGRILEDYARLAVALYAQSLSDSVVTINLMMPGIRSFLKRLASNGVGSSEDYNGVRYRFIECKLESRNLLAK